MPDNCLVSRQPIYDPKVAVAAYELNFSPVVSLSAEKKVDASRAIYNMFTETSLTERALQQNWWKTMPASRAILAFYEEFDPAGPLAEKLSEAAAGNYRIALADSNSSIERFASRAYLIKLDVTAYLPDDLKRRVRDLKAQKLRLLADNLNTYDDLEFAKSLGFDFYKGLFLYKPGSVQTDIPVNRLALIRLLARLQRPDLSMPELEQLISQDVTLSYKMLRYANSPVVALSRSVNSVGHAVRLVGMEAVRNWTTALLLSNIADKPRELMNSALVRARMCEQLAVAIKDPRQESFISAGLFSVLDALLDCPIERVLETLPLSSDIKQGLIKQEGPIGQALRCAVAYERAEWDDIHFYGLPLAPIHDSYMTAISWARNISAVL
jgi:EAL and modified HD-GYP domain-containing signal transduction protein